MPRISVSSSITYCCVVFVFASLFPLALPFNYYCGCDYLWFRLFYQFWFSLFSYSAHTLFDNKFELVICNLGSKRSRCFTHYLNIQLVLERVHLLWFNYLIAILDPI